MNESAVVVLARADWPGVLACVSTFAVADLTRVVSDVAAAAADVDQQL